MGEAGRATRQSSIVPHPGHTQDLLVPSAWSLLEGQGASDSVQREPLSSEALEKPYRGGGGRKGGGSSHGNTKDVYRCPGGDGVSGQELGMGGGGVSMAGEGVSGCPRGFPTSLQQ